MEHSYITLFNPRECQVCVLCIYTHTQMLKVTDMFLDTYYLYIYIFQSSYSVQFGEYSVQAWLNFFP